jgi:hypothetical protein
MEQEKIGSRQISDDIFVKVYPREYFMSRLLTHGLKNMQELFEKGNRSELNVESELVVFSYDGEGTFRYSWSSIDGLEELAVKIDEYGRYLKNFCQERNLVLPFTFCPNQLFDECVSSFCEKLSIELNIPFYQLGEGCNSPSSDKGISYNFSTKSSVKEIQLFWEYPFVTRAK